jgi:hypothetical protein
VTTGVKPFFMKMTNSAVMNPYLAIFNYGVTALKHGIALDTDPNMTYLFGNPKSSVGGICDFEPTKAYVSE